VGKLTIIYTNNRFKKLLDRSISIKVISLWENVRKRTALQLSCAEWAKK